MSMTRHLAPLPQPPPPPDPPPRGRGTPATPQGAGVRVLPRVEAGIAVLIVAVRAHRFN